MAVIFNNDWKDLLGVEFEKEYYIKMRKFLVGEYINRTIYPDKYDIFNTFHYSSYKDTKVCIIGQDPYHGENQAHGLCFSVKPSIKTPPSLTNIYKELQSDLGCCIPNNGYLKKWADQGVLLLNAVLTVRAFQAASHRKIGWETFTDTVISHLNERIDPVVFILWGSFAQSKRVLIDKDRHFIISSVHPSPLSAHRGFFGSKPFSRANEFLKNMNKKEIDWQIENI